MDTFRDRLDRAYRKYRAILILTNGARSDDRLLIDSTAARLRSMPATTLRAHARKFESALKKVTEHYGVTASLEELESLIRVPPEKPGTVMYLAKVVLEGAFTRYDRALPNFARLAPHARVGVDVAALHSVPGKVSIFHLEGSLFEDLAALWNAAMAATDTADRPSATPSQLKQAVALRRSTAKAAFNLLEAYVNGIALDTLLLFHVPEELRIQLEEWDDTRNRAVRLTLRDKLLQYVKIAAQREHPPIQESNSPSMAHVLKAEATLRHALIHPTARVPRGETRSREEMLMDVSMTEVERLCDSVVTLIREIGALLPACYGDVNLWLFDRGSNSLYPESVFA